MLLNMVEGFKYFFTVNNILLMNVGIFFGIIIGAIPGLTVPLAIVLFLPFTFTMEPITGIILLLGLYCGGTYGGSITAILIKTPGTPAAAATLLDGSPMADNGHGRKALDMALVASVIAGVISASILLFMAPQIARLTLKFGPPEYFALAFFGLSIIAMVSGKNIIKGYMTGCLGLYVSTIGLDSFSGTFRFTFGINELTGGIPLLPALIGLFAISEILLKIHENGVSMKDSTQMNNKDKLSLNEIGRCLPTIVKSSLIGTFIGALPGTGAGISSFLSYNEAKRASKFPEKFGTGVLEGVAAAEAGNNGVTGSTLIPLLTLGIPGDGITAVLLGAFMMRGLIPGPLLFVEHGTTVYALMIGLLITNIFMYFQGRFLVKYFAEVSKVPTKLLVSILIILCAAGAYSVSNSTFSIFLIIIFGTIAYILTKLNFSPIPLLLGIILGPIAEQNLRRSLAMSNGNFTVFLTRPISLVVVVITIVTLMFFFLKQKKQNKLNHRAVPKEKSEITNKDCHKRMENV